MKLSVSLSEADVAVLDEFARSAGLSSRSAAVQHAIQLLRHPHLEDDYAGAFTAWDASNDRELWDATTGDGSDAPR